MWIVVTFIPIGNTMIKVGLGEIPEPASWKPCCYRNFARGTAAGIVAGALPETLYLLTGRSHNDKVSTPETERER